MCKLTVKDKAEIQKVYESLFNDPRIKRMEVIKQHRGSNTYYHVLKVTRTAYHLAKASLIKINLQDLIVGAMLHDYFLYDWREDRSKLKGHGHNHPFIAYDNACKDFEINSKVKNIITTHMWPINLFKLHNCIEAHLVSIADKIVSIGEALTSKKHKQKMENRYLSKMFVLEN